VNIPKSKRNIAKAQSQNNIKTREIGDWVVSSNAGLDVTLSKTKQKTHRESIIHMKIGFLVFLIGFFNERFFFFR
jgi:hypothetical protein